MPAALPNRPIDATLSVTKAARLLGVHPNTVRAWSDAGRLRYYRINPRGDRRYRLGDLQRFLSAAAGGSIREFPGAIPRRDGHRAGVSAGSTGLTDLPAAPDADLADRRLDLPVVAELMRLAGSTGDVDRALHYAVTVTRSRGSATTGTAVGSPVDLPGGRTGAASSARPSTP